MGGLLLFWLAATSSSEFLSSSPGQIACQGLPGKLNRASNTWLEMYRGQVQTRGEFHAFPVPTVCSPWPEVQAQYNLVFEFSVFFFPQNLKTLFISILSSSCFFSSPVMKHFYSSSPRSSSCWPSHVRLSPASHLARLSKLDHLFHSHHKHVEVTETQTAECSYHMAEGGTCVLWVWVAEQSHGELGWRVELFSRATRLGGLTAGTVHLSLLALEHFDNDIIEPSTPTQVFTPGWPLVRD